MKLYPVFFLCILLTACKVNKLTTESNLSEKVNIHTSDLVENTTHLQDSTLAPFYHGVASGDPYSESVVIWTRVTPKNELDEIAVTWEISEDKRFINPINTGQLKTSPEKDYTVKAIASSLKPNTQYFYRFKAMNTYSMIGKTKTLPVHEESIKLAVVSCSNVEFGYFNAYAAIVEEDVDAVLHLGDYIYEYGQDKYGDTSFHRKNIPPHEIISLQDYRDRYSQYRLDPDLREVHASTPFINIWDDHEISNNAYVGGAQNHQDNEGSYSIRKDIAKQVFYEWLPIRESDTHYRTFKFGNTMELFMLDERLAGRTAQPDSLTDPRRFAEGQKLLGDEQMDWLIEGLKSSSSNWKVLGNQVIFSYSDWAYERFSQNMDAWDGYPNDQKLLSEAVRSNNIENLIFVTGDTHTAWAFEATSDPFTNYNRTTGEGAIGIEFGVTSITSGNSNERYADEKVKEHEVKLLQKEINPHLKYVNMRDHGYLILEIDQEQITADFKIVKTLKERDASTLIDKTFTVKSGTTKLLNNN